MLERLHAQCLVPSKMSPSSTVSAVLFYSCAWASFRTPPMHPITAGQQHRGIVVPSRDSRVHVCISEGSLEDGETIKNLRPKQQTLKIIPKTLNPKNPKPFKNSENSKAPNPPVVILDINFLTRLSPLPFADSRLPDSERLFLALIRTHPHSSALVPAFPTFPSERRGRQAPGLEVTNVAVGA